MRTAGHALPHDCQRCPESSPAHPLSVWGPASLWQARSVHTRRSGCSHLTRLCSQLTAASGATPETITDPNSAHPDWSVAILGKVPGTRGVFTPTHCNYHLAEGSTTERKPGSAAARRRSDPWRLVGGDRCHESALAILALARAASVGGFSHSPSSALFRLRREHGVRLPAELL